MLNLNLSPVGEPTDTQVSNTDLNLKPPVVEASFEDAATNDGVALSSEVALKIIEKLNTMLDSADLNIADMKDVTNMHKAVSDHYFKLGNKGGASAGLAGFISRLKA